MTKIFENILFLDLETSGLNPERCGILSIGGVWGDKDEFFYDECYLRDGLEIETKALEINRFTLESVRDQRKKSEERLLSDFFKWCANLAKGSKKILICGNNSYFDVSFLKFASARYGMETEMKKLFYSKPIDVASIFYYELMWKKNIEERRSLEKMAVELNLLPNGSFHNALTDATMAKEIFKRLLSEREKKIFFRRIFSFVQKIIKRDR